MQINSIYTNSYLYSNDISFRNNNRFYRTKGRKEFGTNTWMFRKDIDWLALSQYQVRHFFNKDKVNIVQFASSDGSEAYTQIISLLETGKDVEKFFPIKACDRDEVVIDAANSGLINISDKKKTLFDENYINFDKYFQQVDEKLYIQNEMTGFFPTLDEELSTNRTYKVAEDLTKRVEFECTNMYNILDKLEDNSNTILLCRNVLCYFDNDEIDYFIEKASQKLKKDSLLVIGSLDREDLDTEKYLSKYGFVRVMENVYKRL